MSRKIGVVGGGVVGLNCALRLQLMGDAVTLYEPDVDRTSASWGNTGHIATEQAAPLASLASLRSALGRLFARGGALDLPAAHFARWLPFALRMVRASTPRRYERGKAALKSLLADSLPAWTRLAETLGDAGLVKADGHFIAWETRGTASKGRQCWMSGDTGTAHCREADPSDVARLTAISTAPIAGAVRFEGTGQIRDLGDLANTLEHAFEAAGGTIVRTAARIRHANGKAFIVGQKADTILVTAGVTSKALMESIGHKAPMIAERGYHIRGGAGRWPIDLPPVVFEDRSLIVTRYRDCVQTASFVELRAADAPPDPRKWERLERHVAELGLTIDGPYARWMGSRPTFPDYLPAIGRSVRAPNLYYAFGHQHLGLTLAATTAEIIADLMSGGPGGIDLTPFDIQRFA